MGIIILKIITSFLTVCVSVFAVLSDFRDKNNKLNKIGKLSIVLIVVLGIGTLILGFFEQMEEDISTNAKFKESLNDTKNHIDSTNRILQEQYRRNVKLDSQLNQKISYLKDSLIAHQVKNIKLSENTIKGMETAIINLKKLQKLQKDNLGVVNDIQTTSTENLDQIKLLHDNTNRLVYSLSDVKIFLRVKYIYNDMLTPSFFKNEEQSAMGTSHMVGIFGMEHYPLDHQFGKPSDLISAYEDFWCPDLKVSYKFKSNCNAHELIENNSNTIDFENDFNRIFYTYGDSSYLKEYLIQPKLISNDPEKMPSLVELFKKLDLIIEFENDNTYLAHFSRFFVRNYTVSKPVASYMDNSDLRIVDVKLEPYLKVLYGKDFIYSKQFKSEYNTDSKMICDTLFGVSLYNDFVVNLYDNATKLDNCIEVRTFDLDSCLR